jgi:hypothetical protein
VALPRIFINNRRIYCVYSSVTDEYTRQGPRGTAQVYLLVNRRIYLGFKIARAPFSFPPLSHFEMPARAKRPHTTVASAATTRAPSRPRRSRPAPPPVLLTSCAPGRRPQACRHPRPSVPPTHVANLPRLTDIYKCHMASIFVG